MKLAIIMPVWIQNEAVLRMTYEALATVKTSHNACIFLVTTRLHGITPEDLSLKAFKRCSITVNVLHEAGVERSVAAAWNHGCRAAIAWGADLLCLMANDVLLEENALDRLADFAEQGRSQNVAIWSGLHHGLHASGADVEHCDFSCVMFPPATLDRYGWFDENLHQAYFEDNDFAARVILGGQEFRAIPAIRFYHRGSATIKLDPEAARNVERQFGLNREYFVRKWGSFPLNTAAEIREKYFKQPFNDPAKKLSDW